MRHIPSNTRNGNGEPRRARTATIRQACGHFPFPRDDIAQFLLERQVEAYIRIKGRKL